MKLKKVYAFLASLLIGASLVACSGNGAAVQKKIGTAVDGNEVKIESAAMKFAKDWGEGGYDLISTEELKKKIDANEDMIIVDTMPASSFAKNHIKGAVNAELPADGVDKVTPEQKDAFLKVLGEDKDKTIVIYCGFVGCARSHVGGVIAKEAGYKNVLRQPGGIIAWTDAGYELEK